MSASVEAGVSSPHGSAARVVEVDVVVAPGALVEVELVAVVVVVLELLVVLLLEVELGRVVDVEELEVEAIVDELVEVEPGGSVLVVVEVEEVDDDVVLELVVVVVVDDVVVVTGQFSQHVSIPSRTTSGGGVMLADGRTVGVVVRDTSAFLPPTSVRRVPPIAIVEWVVTTAPEKGPLATPRLDNVAPVRTATWHPSSSVEPPGPPSRPSARSIAVGATSSDPSDSTSMTPPP